MAERTLTNTRYLTLLDGISSSELSDMERQVRDTVNSPGWQVLQRLWEDRERTLTDQLVHLPPSTDTERYAALTAQIRGLQDASQAPEALAEAAERKRQEAHPE